MASVADIRDTALYRETAGFYSELWGDGSENLTDASQLAFSADGSCAAFTGHWRDERDGRELSGLFLIPPDAQRPRLLTAPTVAVRLATWSGHGRSLAYVREDRETGEDELAVVEVATGSSVTITRVRGGVESCEWSSSGNELMVVVAESGTDNAAIHGAVSRRSNSAYKSDKTPEVHTKGEYLGWRRLWVIDASSGRQRLISPDGLNIWEAVRLSENLAVAIVSESPRESDWYDAWIASIDLTTREWRRVYMPRLQIGCLAPDPLSGRVAFIEAPSSDRGVVCGELKVLQVQSGVAQPISTHDVDVAYVARRRGRSMFSYAGHRRFHTVIGDVDQAGTADERWSSREYTIGEYYPAVCPIGDEGFAALLESYASPPFLAFFMKGAITRTVAIVNGLRSPSAQSVGKMVAVEWQARDGQSLDGWLIEPRASAPAPLVVDVHGGPIWLARNRWLGRLRAAPLLARAGCAVFYPNPRGSTGRGRPFVEAIRGDLGGIDASDILDGVDALIRTGKIDAARLGLHGISYGGFMTCWLVTQQQRFRAAVAVSPITDWYSQYGTSHIGRFNALFLGNDIAQPGGRYFSRSPVIFADRVTTPTLLIAGKLDRNTPPGQALEFYTRLAEGAVPCALAIYPEEGHGVRQPGPFLDYVTRTLAWFILHLPLNAAPDRG